MADDYPNLRCGDMVDVVTFRLLTPSSGADKAVRPLGVSQSVY